MITEEIITIDGEKIGYEHYGNGERRLLLIPGGVGCYKKDYPDELLKIFNPELVTLIVWDPPGYGTSRPPDRQQAVNRCQLDAQVAIKLMQRLDLTPFTVVGWSEGGRTAIHIAHNGRDSVHKLIIFGASSRTDARGARVFESMRNTDLWLLESKQDYLKYYDEEYFRKQWADICDLIKQVYRDLGGRFPCDLCLKNIRQPVLVLHGAMDRLCYEPTYFLQKFPNVRQETHALGSHDFHIKYPKWFVEQIENFVNEP